MGRKIKRHVMKSFDGIKWHRAMLCVDIFYAGASKHNGELRKYGENDPIRWAIITSELGNRGMRLMRNDGKYAINNLFKCDKKH